MEVKNGKVMFCYNCSNGNLNGGCIYGREDKCGITERRLNKIFNKTLESPEWINGQYVLTKHTLIKKLKECGELPYNFKKFRVA